MRREPRSRRPNVKGNRGEALRRKAEGGTPRRHKGDALGRLGGARGPQAGRACPLGSLGGVWAHLWSSPLGGLQAEEQGGQWMARH